MKEGIRQRVAMIRQLLDEVLTLATAANGEKKKRRYTRRAKKPGPK